MNESSLTKKQTKCSGSELFGVLEELNRNGWRVSILAVKGTADYVVTAYLDWGEPIQEELIK